jgi:nitroimidazol reductase NimA-like FMN-containing flavoprotein (pyridoxamine 5'-phosphate oxidase superfamily)
MRRSDKEISDAGVIEGILKAATVCRLALCESNQPYVVPLCFGYQDNALYIHSAGQGKKLNILRKNNNVCFEVDIDHELKEADQACGWGMKFKSVIGFGKAVLVEDIESKRKALDIIMHQYSESTFEYPQDAITDITIIKVEIESMTGKQSG